MSLAVTFSNRDFTARVPPDIDMSVQRYSHSAIGGPRQATIAVGGGEEELWSLLNMIRCPVEINTDKTEPAWWGYVQRVDLSLKKYTIAADITEMANSVRVAYGAGLQTSFLSDTDSVDEFGTKEVILSLANVSVRWANQYRQNYLNSHRYPLVDVQLSGVDEPSGTITCAGWWSTLDWRYADIASGSVVDTSSQIQTIITTYGDYLQGSSAYGTARTNFIRTDSGITSNPYQDGYSTCRAVIDQICETGTTNAYRLLPTVTPSRVVEIKVEPSYTSTGNVCVLRSGGELLTPYGEYIRPELCKVGTWASVADIIPSTVDVSRLSDLPYFFIEESEYDAIYKSVRYTPRGISNLWQLTSPRHG
jgi:hypothetical protein